MSLERRKTNVSETYAQWTILELMGHRRLAGWVTEQEIAGKGFLRIDIPGPDGATATQFYSPDSVYGMTPTTEEIARRLAANNVPAPVARWELAPEESTPGSSRKPKGGHSDGQERRKAGSRVGESS
jgi:hypothetical protein